MAEDLIRYDILAQEALRGVVRKVLTEVARTGLPGEHHFFISFVTKAPGVRVSQRLVEQYDKEMTIVLQIDVEPAPESEDPVVPLAPSAESPAPVAAASPAEPKGEKVVSLDSFR